MRFFRLKMQDITWLKFVRFYLDKTIKLCRLNPAGGERAGFGPPVGLARLPLWSQLIELFYVYFALKLLVCQVLQHKYNVILHALSVLDTERANNSNNNNNTGTYALTWQLYEAARAEKQAELKRAESRLDLIGNIYCELGFGAEPLFVYMLIIIHLIYVQTRLFMALRGPVAFGVLQMLLDPERERALVTDKQIQHQVNQFIVSSKNFMLASREQVLEAHGMALKCAKVVAGPEGARLKRLNHNHLQLHLFELECAHERAVDEALELARSGRLVPPNRRPESVAHMARVYGALVISSECMGACSVITVLLILPLSGMLLLKPRTEFRHLLFLVEIVCHGLIGIQHLTFYLANGFMSAYEQLQFVRKLASTIDELIRDTCSATTACELSEFRNLCRPQLAIGTEFGDRKSRIDKHKRLNRRLICILILYKLFLSQMRTTQFCVGFIGAHITLLMLVVPMLNRIYVVYLPIEVRWIMLACAIIIIIAGDCLVVPNCTLHARCLDLFRSMSSLLAHIDAHQALRCYTERSKQRLYDEHTVWLLRREQNAPELALRRFATDAHFLHLTYANFIGVHFWCGLLLAPMFLRDNARLGTSGDLITDTLKIF